MTSATRGPSEDGSGGDQERTVRQTNRWRGIVAVVLVALAAGLLAKRPSLLMLAAVAVAFAAYPQLSDPPDPALEIERRIDPESPDVGDPIEVTTTLRNVGEGTLYDLRLVDGVPPTLPVEDGSPRRGTALRPGGETTIEYSVRSARGTHRFRPTIVLARDASGAIETETTVIEETVIECAGRVPEVPLRPPSRHRSGRLATDDGGSGLEFHRIKEYERGDPTSRIDWRRYARTGELASMEFRKEQIADVVLCVDAREAAYRAGSVDEPHAVARAIDAAERIADTLFGADHRVGLAAFGRELCWLPPGTGRDHTSRFLRLLSTHEGLSPIPLSETGKTSLADGPPTDDICENSEDGELDRQLSTILTHLNSRTQVFLFTPLCDDEAARIPRRLESGGCAVTVVSPDVTTSETVGGRLARIERQNRLTSLRHTGVAAVDWGPDERIGKALADLGRWVA